MNVIIIIATLAFLEPKSSEDSKAKTILVACSSDRGLCGAIHSSICKPIKAVLRKEPENNSVVVLGDKAKVQISRAARQNIMLSFSSLGKAPPTFSEAASVTDKILSSGAEFGKAKLYYNAFTSVIAYELKIVEVYTKEALLGSEKLAQFELEDEVIENYAEFSFANAIYSALAEGHASEMAARRTAMENATKNAGSLFPFPFFFPYSF